jgi:hypothetical protein
MRIDCVIQENKIKFKCSLSFFFFFFLLHFTIILFFFSHIWFPVIISILFIYNLEMATSAQEFTLEMVIIFKGFTLIIIRSFTYLVFLFYAFTIQH